MAVQVGGREQQAFRVIPLVQTNPFPNPPARPRGSPDGGESGLTRRATHEKHNTEHRV